MDNTKTLLSDFRELSRPSYKDYLEKKCITLLDLENINGNVIKKTFNELVINNKIFNLENKSINDLINILFEELPELDVYFYEDHSEYFLNSSAMFLGDFDTELAVTFTSTDEIVNSNLIETYKDKYSNNYTLNFLKVFDEFNRELEYYKRPTSYRMSVKSQRLKLICLYSAVNLKLNYLQEFPISSLNQLVTMSKDRSLNLWN